MKGVLVQVGAVVAVVAVVAGAVIGLLIFWWLGLAVFVAIAAVAGVFVANRVRAAEDGALRFVGPVRPAEPTAGTGEARFVNLVEGLASSAGVPRPRCLVLDSQTPNALALGRDHRHGCLVITAALLDQLSRIELEGVVAHGLVRLRDGSAGGPTLAMALMGTGSLLERAIAKSTPNDATDLEAVALTRYPPGLLGALKVVADAGPEAPAASSKAIASMWLGPPEEDGQDIARRIDALHDL